MWESKNENIKMFYALIENSWTYEKLTDSEREKIKHILNDENITKIVKGTHKQKLDILNAIYNIFLLSIGYTGFNWRNI